MLVVFGLLLTIYFGLLLTLIIIPQIHPLERLGLSYVLGLGVMTVLMFAALLLKITLTSTNVLIFLLMTFLFSLLFLRKRIALFLEELKPILLLSELNKISLIEKGLIAVILALGAYAFITSLYWSVHAWDAVTLFDFRGKILANPDTAAAYMRGELDMKQKLEGYYYSYPLLTSLGHTLVYLFYGKNPLFLSALFYTSFTLMFYGAVREVAPRGISLLATLLLISNVSLIQHATAAYANLPYAVYYAMGTIYLFLWMTKRKKGYFLIASLLTALSVWTRDSEPFWLANLGVLVIYAFLKKAPLYPVLYFLIVTPIRFIWGSFKDKIFSPVYITSNQFRKSLLVISKVFSIQRFMEVISFLSGALFPRYLPIILFFCVILVLDIKNILKNDRIYILLLIFSNLAVFVLGSYIFSFMFFDWIKIPGSAERVFMFFPALFIFYIALAIGSIIKKDSFR